jgi:hypothetical protein
MRLGSRTCLVGETLGNQFMRKTSHTLKIREQHVITVTGKAFYDIGHAPADHGMGNSSAGFATDGAVAFRSSDSSSPISALLISLRRILFKSCRF